MIPEPSKAFRLSADSCVNIAPKATLNKQTVACVDQHC